MAYHITYRTGVTFYEQKIYNLRNLIQVKKIIKNNSDVVGILILFQKYVGLWHVSLL